MRIATALVQCHLHTSLVQRCHHFVVLHINRDTLLENQFDTFVMSMPSCSVEYCSALPKCVFADKAAQVKAEFIYSNLFYSKPARLTRLRSLSPQSALEACPNPRSGPLATC